MTTAYEIMTRSLASVTPQTSVAQAATLMRDLNIGDVLVLENGNLRGIVTDRDLTINVLTNGAKSDAPVERYMSTDVVTGAPDWSLEQVADVMGKHQIRRLPIVQDDNVVGIVSLGDVALHTSKRETVAKSLKNISEVTQSAFQQATPLTKFVTIAIPVALGAAVLIFANSKSGQRMRKQIETSDFADQTRAFVNETAHALQDPKTRQAALAALAATGIPEKTRQAVYDGVRTLQDPKTRQVAFDALEATGLPARTRQVFGDGVHTLQDTQSRAGNATRERVMQFADDTRWQAQHLSKQVNLPQEFTKRFKKQKPKRFLFA
jgi:CBS domain-containing protein